MRQFIVLMIITTSLLVGCSVFAPMQIPEVHTYQITGALSDTTACTTNGNGGILQVTLMKADSPYDNTKMFYSTAQYELNSYSYHRWISDPNIMLTQAIQEKILQSCIYANVVSSDFMTTSQYRLTTQLLELKQIMNGSLSKTSTLHLAIIAQLVDNRTNQVIKGKTFIEETKVEANPAGYVAGTNQVTQMFLTDLISWLK